MTRRMVLIDWETCWLPVLIHSYGDQRMGTPMMTVTKSTLLVLLEGAVVHHQDGDLPHPRHLLLRLLVSVNHDNPDASDIENDIGRTRWKNGLINCWGSSPMVGNFIIVGTNRNWMILPMRKTSMPYRMHGAGVLDVTDDGSHTHVHLPFFRDCLGQEDVHNDDVNRLLMERTAMMGRRPD